MDRTRIRPGVHEPAPATCAALCMGLCTVLWMALAGIAAAGEYNGKVAQSLRGESQLTRRLIVKWSSAPAAVQRRSAGPVYTAADSAAAAQKLAAASGVRMKYLRAVSDGLDVIELEQGVTARELPGLLASLQRNPDVQFVEPDVWRRPHRVPSDALFPGQWYLRDQEIASTRALHAWDTTQGSVGTVVAILDTGVRFDHPDLGAASVLGPGKLLPGFDFVSPDIGGSFLIANDGSGRDANPSDPGDWIDSQDLQDPVFGERDCPISDSSWHGTRVSGIVAALSDNGQGVSGTSWNTWLLPVRVLGKCGGFDSDVLTGMRWAAGLPVGGVPANPFPAQIINLSLGSEGDCGQAARLTIEQVSARGVVIVASAGNDGGPVDSPANCPGVVSVGALRHIGTKVGFSNVGRNVVISAPGGNCVNTNPGQPCLFSIDTTVNLGATTASASGYTGQQNINVGTSFSAPIVSGTVALMHSVNARLTPDRFIRRLRASARPFPTTSTTTPPPPVCHVPASQNDLQVSECICTTSTCGAGMLDAEGAVAEALRPAAVITFPDNFTAGQPVVLDGSSSGGACNRTVTSYAWTVSPQSPRQPAIANPGQAQATVTSPTTSAESFVLRLTVTDDAGDTDFADVTVGPTTAITSAGPLLPVSACPAAISPPSSPGRDDLPPGARPSMTGGGGGGGGANLSSGLLLLALALGLRRVRYGVPGLRTVARAA